MSQPKIGEIGIGSKWIDLSKVEAHLVDAHYSVMQAPPTDMCWFTFTTTQGNVSERTHLHLQASVMDDLAEQWLAERGYCVLPAEHVDHMEVSLV
jgi:hypothetical protein